MARTGLYKSEVKQARDALVVQGKHPSVDAVRIALGNTGSKTTIHKYLKELGEEDGGADGRKASISEALQDLVARLAAQLQEEANLRIDKIQLHGADKDRHHAEAMAALKHELVTLGTQLQRAEAAAHQEVTAHGRTRDALQQETITRHTLDQQVTDLKERLTENEAHRQSIEDKHRHAREAREHYRASIKEQRDQDHRRHEQQVQQLQAEMRQLQQTLIVKQDDVTRLNHEGARLVADLSHAQKALYEQQARGRQLEQKLEAIQVAEHQGKAVAARLAEKEFQAQAQLDASNVKTEELVSQVRDLELALAAADAKLAAQQEVTMGLRAYFEARDWVAENKTN